VTRSGSGRDLRITGGLETPFGPDTTQAGEALKRNALSALMSGSDQVTPQVVKPREAGAGENLMAGAGMGMNVLGALGTANKIRRYF